MRLCASVCTHVIFGVHTSHFCMNTTAEICVDTITESSAEGIVVPHHLCHQIPDQKTYMR